MCKKWNHCSHSFKIIYIVYSLILQAITKQKPREVHFSFQNWNLPQNQNCSILTLKTVESFETILTIFEGTAEQRNTTINKFQRWDNTRWDGCIITRWIMTLIEWVWYSDAIGHSLLLFTSSIKQSVVDG